MNDFLDQNGPNGSRWSKVDQFMDQFMVQFSSVSITKINRSIHGAKRALLFGSLKLKGTVFISKLAFVIVTVSFKGSFLETYVKLERSGRDSIRLSSFTLVLWSSIILPRSFLMSTRDA